MHLLISLQEQAQKLLFLKKKTRRCDSLCDSSFRISDDAINKDISFIEKMGVEIKTGTEITSVQELKAEGYDAVIVAGGARNRAL